VKLASCYKVYYIVSDNESKLHLHHTMQIFTVSQKNREREALFNSQLIALKVFKLA